MRGVFPGLTGIRPIKSENSFYREIETNLILLTFYTATPRITCITRYFIPPI